MDKASVPSNVLEEKMTCLMNTYGTSILRMCYAYLKDAASAEDAAQDTFIKAYQSMSRLRSPEDGGEKAWLMRIAINTCKDYRRNTWFRHVDRHVDVDRLPAFTNALTPVEKILLDDVMALAPKYKDVILLFYYQGLSAEEIEKVLNVPKTTVYSRIKRAKEKLRVTLERGYQDA